MNIEIFFNINGLIGFVSLSNKILIQRSFCHSVTNLLDKQKRMTEFHFLYPSLLIHLLLHFSIQILFFFFNNKRLFSSNRRKEKKSTMRNREERREIVNDYLICLVLIRKRIKFLFISFII